MASNETRKTPQYVKIAGVIRNRIKAGVLRPGDRVPSAAALCDEFEVSMITAKNALNLLKSEGTVIGVAGKATYVAEDHRLIRTAPHRYFEQSTRTYVQESERAGLTPTADHDTTAERANEWVARRLDIEPGDAVMATRYYIAVDGQPLSVSTAWEPLAITGGTEIEHPHEGPHGQSGLNARFAAIGWTIDQVEEHLIIRDADPSEAATLLVPEGSPVVEIRQTVRAVQDGTDDLIPVEAADIVFRTDRYEFRYLMDRPR